MKKPFFHPALLAFVLYACGTAAGRERIDGIQRVMMHDVDELSFMVADGTGAMRLRKLYAETVVFVRDVSPDKPMWAEYYSDGGCSKGGAGDILTVHLHGAAEVEGAGWNRGKSGDGRTNAVE